MIENKILKLLQKTITTLMCFWMLTTQMPINVVFADEINTEENIVEDINEDEINNVDDEEEDQIIIEEDVETINKEDDEIIDSEIIEEAETETSVNQELLDRVNTLLNIDITSITDIDELTNVHDNTNNIIEEYNELSSDEQINIDYDSLLSFKYDVTKLLIDRLVESLPSEDEINIFDDVQKQIAPTRKLVRSTIPNLISELNVEDQTNYNNQYSSLLSDITTWLADRQKAIMNGGVVSASTTYSYTLLDYIDSDGKAYIKTGYKHNTNTKVETKVKIKNESVSETSTAGWAVIYGSKTSGGNQNALVIGYNIGGTTNGKFFYNIGGKRTDDEAGSYNFTTDYKFEFGNNLYKVNDGSNILEGSNLTQKYEDYIFADNVQNTLTEPSKIRLYYLKINDSSGTQRDYVPAKRNDGTVGLFDLKNSKFYENAGEGSFKAGSATGAILIYDANGHGTAPSAVTMKYSSATKTASISATGYTFNGWNTKADGTGTTYAAGAQFKAANVNPTPTTLYAKWTKDSYNISYDLAGGSVSTANPSSYNIETATFTLNNPTRTGYTFAGWTGSNGTTKQTTVTIAKGSTGNKSYTANWTAKSSTISLDGNGATSTGHTTSTTATYGSAMPYITLPTRTGYNLLGYFDAQEGGTKYYDSDNSNQSARNWDKEDASVTLYAQWKPSTYIITLDRGGATSGSTSVTATYNSVLPEISNLPSKVGYTFDGYYTGSNGTGTKYYDENGTSSRIWTGTSNLTLYANWILSSYKITFNKNGGNGGTDEIGITYNETMQSISVPTKDGYTFDGYYDGESTETKYYNADGSPAVPKWNKGKSAILYAHWTKSVYTITYTLNGGTVVTTNPSSYSVDTETFTLNNPTKIGYTFAGWTGTGLSSASTSVSITKGSTGNRSYTATWIANTNTAYKVEHYQQNTDASTYPLTPKDAEDKTGTSGASVKPEVKSYTGFTSPSAQTVTIAGDGSTVVKYYYTRNKYKVTLDFNGGNSSQKELTAIYGAPIRVDIKPDRTGYYFNGYYDAKDGGTEYINSDTTSAHVWDKTSDATLYAHWRASQSTIYFDNQGGIGTTPSITATYDVNLESISSNNLPTKEGYTFEGYFDAIFDGKQYYSSTGASLEAWDKIGTQATLYAHWSAKISTITFDKQHGTGGTDSTTVTYGSSMPSITLPTRSGYYFGGYYTSTNGSGIQYYSANGSSTKDWDRIINTTLYAYWKEIIQIPTPNYDLYYNATMQVGVWPSPYYKVENGGALNAGTYTAIVTPNNGYVWPDGTADPINISYTINKKDIVGSTIELSEYEDYAGNPVEPKVISVITIPEKIRLSSSDYTVSYLDNTMSDGNNSEQFAYVVITANENTNFTGTAQKQFTINKKKCKVSFVTNGGTDLEDLEVYYGTVLSPLSFTKPTKDGYNFYWWYTDESLKTELDSIYVIKDDMILYAKYDLANYTITYTLNGGSVSTANPSSYNIETTTFTLNNPTKEGYLFTGWTGTSLSTLTTDVEILTGSTGNREYIAYYDKKINVPLAKENLICDDTEQIGVEEGEGYTITGNSATEAGTYIATASLKDGYVWSDGTYGNKEIEFTIKDNRFEVSFNVLGSGTTGLPEGSIVESIEPKTVRLGETYGSMVKPTYVGYTFVGWFLDNVEITEESIVELTDNVTLVAHWNKIDALVKIASKNRLSNAIEYDGTYSYFDTLIKAINSASENDELIIVKDFSNDPYTTEVNKSLTINVENHIFNYYTIKIDSGKTLTLTGNGGTLGGRVASSNSNTNIIIDGDLTVSAIIDTSGSVQLINGTVSGELSVGASGSVNMTGGIFLTTNTYVYVYGETTITGGSFSESSKSFATWNNRMDKNKYKLVYNEETNLYDVTELEDVVSIRDKKYKTLEAALADAEDGDELIVLRDIVDENSSSITIDNDITINLNNHTIHNINNFIYYINGDLTINGEGEIYSEKSLDASIRINSGNVTFNNVTTNISINVGSKEATCVLNLNGINNGKTGADEGAKIYASENATVNVVNGTISRLYKTNTTDGSNVFFNISGDAYFTGGSSSSYSFNDIPKENITITGGDFPSDVKYWLRGPYTTKIHDYNRYKVEKYTGDAVAKIESDNQLDNAIEFDNGYSYYATLANAIKDATSTETKVTLLKDVAEHDLTIIANQNVTLDLNGKTIDANHEGRLFINKGTLTINDSSSEHAGKLINGRFNGTIGNNNDSAGNGIRNEGTLNINGGTISGCTNTTTNGAGRGGAIFTTGNGSVVNFAGGSITNSNALYGGAIYVTEESSLLMSETASISECNNTASDWGGGAIHIYKASATINNGTISNCTSSNRAGAIYVHNSTLTINNVLINNCTATNGGQAIEVDCTDGNSTIEITGGTIKCNDSTKELIVIGEAKNDHTITNNITGGWYSRDIIPSINYGIYKSNDEEHKEAPYTVTSNYYTITYNSNGGSNIEPEKIYSLPDHSVKTIIMNEVPTKDYETFTGWNTMADGTGTRYVAGDEITLAGDITLYAQWQEQKVKVELHSKALISGNSISSVGQLSGGGNNIVKGKMHLITAESNDTYQFDHWDINGVIKEDANLNYVFTEDTVVYAIYRYEPSKGIHVNIEAEKPFTVKTLEKKSWLVWDYYEDGIYVAENKNGKYDVNIKVVAGSQVELIYDNTNNDFSGWVSRYGSIVSKNPEFIMHEIYVETDLRLETNTKVKKYYAEFIGYGNQIIKADNFESLEELKALSNTVLAAPSSGYTFVGWEINEVLLEDVNSIDDLTFENDETTVKLLPKYEKIESKKTITISSYVDGKEYKDDIITEYDEGSNVVISAPEVNDQTVQFICWSADKDGNDVLSTNEKYPIKVINNIHIYAIYSEEKQQEQIPTVIANGVSTTGSDSSTSLVFNISRNVPEESIKYRIVESGILYSMSSSWKNKTDSQVEDSLRFSSVNPTTGNVTLKSGAKRSAETDTASSGSQTLYVNVTGHTGDFVYLRGYMIVSCSDREEPMIIYTNVYKVSYNTASNPTIIKTRVDSNTN